MHLAFNATHIDIRARGLRSEARPGDRAKLLAHFAGIATLSCDAFLHQPGDWRLQLDACSGEQGV